MKVMPAVSCETTIVRDWTSDLVWGPELPISKEVCLKFPSANFSSNGRFSSNAICRPDGEAITCLGMALKVGCDILVESLGYPKLHPQLMCLFGGPKQDELMYSALFKMPLEKVPKKNGDGARCTELPTREISKARNAELFAPVLANLPVGSDRTAVEKLLERNGFIHLPEDPEHYRRFIPLIQKTEVNEIGWAYAYSYYVGTRIDPIITDRTSSVADNGPAEGLCMFLE